MMVGDDTRCVLTRSTHRRQVLVGLVAFVATWILFPRRALGQAGEPCSATPPQTEGPYYPPKTQLDAQRDKDGDLTRLEGQAGRAAGVVLYVLGRVRDADCRPIPDATVEIWQASENGRYRHPRDRDNPAPLDPNFQYWGRSVTDQDGRYVLKTIKPGSYQAGPGWIRPPHIHFKVSHPGFRDFITQMYFVGDPHQTDDYILNKVPSAQRDRVIVTMEKPDKDFEPDARVCRFDLTLSR